ncbi:hypothetical protein EJ04DRAFT_555419 [Polyplosphaeria fusca]|uniref:Uncharacterized protein n=1 Tax=Polyplosphaeria fusca TaxID=682080 RepID=A0A9P4QT63_9PLEO|nr:hypothetical protein EJ04DRAFT_555419 [Polyplosphaeria fusca]
MSVYKTEQNAIAHEKNTQEFSLCLSNSRQIIFAWAFAQNVLARRPWGTASLRGHRPAPLTLLTLPYSVGCDIERRRGGCEVFEASMSSRWISDTIPISEGDHTCQPRPLASATPNPHQHSSFPETISSDLSMCEGFYEERRMREQGTGKLVTRWALFKRDCGEDSCRDSEISGKHIQRCIEAAASESSSDDSGEKHFDRSAQDDGDGEDDDEEWRNTDPEYRGRGRKKRFVVGAVFGLAAGALVLREARSHRRRRSRSLQKVVRTRRDYQEYEQYHETDMVSPRYQREERRVLDPGFRGRTPNDRPRSRYQSGPRRPFENDEYDDE